MNLSEEYSNYRLNSKLKDPAKRILFAVLKDLFDRRGFRQVWDEVAQDEEVAEELLATNLKIVKKNLR